MSVSEKLMTFGEFSVSLKAETPDRLLEAIQNHMLGTIYITPSRIDPNQIHPREVARYAGILRKRDFSDDQRTISGSGLLWLLGDQNKRGPGVNKTPIDLTGQSFTDAITAALTGTDITPGLINPEAGSLPAGQFWLQTARYKVEEISRQFGTEFRINPKAQLDAGSAAFLWPSTVNPVVFVRRGASGVDPDWKPIPTASAAMGSDLVNYATEKLLVADVDGIPTIQGQAVLSPPTSKRGPNGTLLQITDVGAESQVGQAAANDRAAALLAQLAEPRNSVALATDDFDMFGTAGTGDSVLVWDPDIGFYDINNPIQVQGEWFFPLKLRVFGDTWPLLPGMGVYLQEPTLDADLHDLSEWYLPESGSTQLEVGAASRKLIPEPQESLGGIIAPVVNPGITPPSQPNAPTVSGNILHIMVEHDLGTGGTPFSLEPFTHHLEVHASKTSGFTPSNSTYIGDIGASNSQISAGTPVLGVFELEDADQHYVRVIAVGINGLKSPASAEAGVSINLIPDAAIINLTASKITAGTITASISILSPLIIGGILQTAASGQRVALEEGDPDRAKFYTGDADEGTEGFVHSAVTGSGTTKQLYLLAIGPRFAGQATGSFATQSGFADGSVKPGASISATEALSVNPVAQVAAQTDLVQGWLGSTAGRRWTLSATQAALLYGHVSNDPLLLITATGVQLRRSTPGRTLLIDGDAATLAYTANERRVRVQIDRASIIGSDNVVKLDVRDDQINAWRNVAMNDWGLRLRTAGDANHYLIYNSAIDGPELRGAARFWLRGFTADVSLYADGGELHVMNYAAASYRGIDASAFNVSSDRHTKSKIVTVDDAECAEALSLTPVRSFVRDGRAGVGYVAQEVPATAQKRHTTREGTETITYDLAAMCAYNTGAIRHLLTRVKQLEAGNA